MNFLYAKVTRHLDDKNVLKIYSKFIFCKRIIKNCVKDHLNYGSVRQTTTFNITIQASSALFTYTRLKIEIKSSLAL